MFCFWAYIVEIWWKSPPTLLSLSCQETALTHFNLAYLPKSPCAGCFSGYLKDIQIFVWDTFSNGFWPFVTYLWNQISLICRGCLWRHSWHHCAHTTSYQGLNSAPKMGQPSKQGSPYQSFHLIPVSQGQNQNYWAKDETNFILESFQFRCLTAALEGNCGQISFDQN